MGLVLFLGVWLFCALRIHGGEQSMAQVRQMGDRES